MNIEAFILILINCCVDSSSIFIAFTFISVFIGLGCDRTACFAAYRTYEDRLPAVIRPSIFTIHKFVFVGFTESKILSFRLSIRLYFLS